MSQQKGRRLKQLIQKEKKESRQGEKRRRNNKQKGKQRDKANDHLYIGNSKYAKKKLLQKKGVYAERSPFKVVQPENPVTNPIIQNNKQSHPQEILLTKLFNKGSDIQVITRFRDLHDYFLPPPPRHLDQAPSLLMAVQKNDKWSLTRQFKTSVNGDWEAQKLPMSNSVKDRGQIISLLSKWQYLAYHKSGQRGETPHGLVSEGNIVGAHGSLYPYEAQP